MDATLLLERARQRCSRHRPSRTPIGLCRDCFEDELVEVLLEKHPELCRGDAFELVQEWLRMAEEPAH